MLFRSSYRLSLRKWENCQKFTTIARNGILVRLPAYLNQSRTITLSNRIAVPTNRLCNINMTTNYLDSKVNKTPIKYCNTYSFHARHYTVECSNSTHQTTPVFLMAQKYGDKLAVISQHGRYTYKDLITYSSKLADEITYLLTNTDNSKEQKEAMFPLQGKSVAFLCENDMSYIVTLWAVWMLGGVAVPLCKSHPISELKYFVSDSQASLMLSTFEYQDKLENISKTLKVPLKVLSADDYGGEYDEMVEQMPKRGEKFKKALVSDKYRQMQAMIVYTSGTTGRPKGVVHTHGSLDAQILGMIKAWSWTSHDVILHVLPLHHVHGIVNVLLTPLYCGATCVMMPKFDTKDTWGSLLKTDTEPQVNLFMAVPTIYAKLTEEFDLQSAGHDLNIEGQGQINLNNAVDILQKKIRLMVSGSAALPQPVMDRWCKITGHTLLERYGMTELGMALTNPLHGTRQPGAVGMPFPGVSACIVNHHDDGTGYDVIVTAYDTNITQTPGMEGMQGELLVKGDNVFTEYWNKPEATAEAFTTDGWFKTGDTAVYRDGVFRIVGRTSVDVIKSGAYKISALDIERHLLSHPAIRDVAVLGLPDETWGQVVAAVLVLRPGHNLDLDGLKSWAREIMPSYHIPRILKCLHEMPRNAMGKVNKKELSKSVFPEYVQRSNKILR